VRIVEAFYLVSGEKLEENAAPRILSDLEDIG
jgi:hypothetical protein